MADQFTFYGFPDECRKFEQRHPLWNEIMPNLVHAMNIRIHKSPGNGRLSE